MTPPRVKQPADRKRPSTQRKHTRATEDKRRGALEQGIKVTLDGESYLVRLGDITSTIAREYRRAAGSSVNELMEQIQRRPDVDSIASFVWLSRRIGGEDDLELDDVVINYLQLLDDGFDISLPDELDQEAEKGSPEA